MAEIPIRGEGFTIKLLFTRFRFSLDPYQREYSWERKDVKALIDDLARHFESEWNLGHERPRTRTYRPYFLGPFVYYEGDNEMASLVDGQQRITTLHLLLIHLRLLAMEADSHEYRKDIGELDSLIANSSYGEQTFAISAPDRQAVLGALLEDEPYKLRPTDSPSVKNLYDRSRDLNDLLPETLRDEALPLFIHWLLNRVCLVGIDANDRQQGWEIFETMNDRGVQLGPADLLKSFLFRKANPERLARLGERWRELLSRLQGAGEYNPTQFLQSLLIGRYAADLGDVANIRVSFHGWVQDHASERMKLKLPRDFAGFVESDLAELSKRFATLSGAARSLQTGLEAVYYNARNEIDQMPFYLAVLQPDDSDELFRDKCRRVAAYLDFVYVRLMVNNKLGKSEQMFGELLPLLADLQTCPDLDALEKLLGHRAAAFEYDFTAVKQYGLRPDNRAQVRYLLARLTAFVEIKAGRPNEMSRYLDLAEPFEIEHVWANRFERHQAEVKTQDSFRIQRNRLGALLLLQKSHNASYQDQPFEKKVEWYRGQNQLAASLHPVTHERNRPFTEDVVKEYNLQKLLRAFNHFDLAAIEVREQLYERLCEIIWDPKELDFHLPPQPTAPAVVAAKAVSKRTRAHFGGVTVARLVEIGVLSSGDDLSLTYRRESHSAQINEQGRIELKTGEQFDSPSPAGATVTGKSINGWNAWKLRKDGKLTALHDIRKDALARGLLDS